MLSHSGSNASSSNLRRSKSSTSVKERRKHPLIPQSLDPSTARLHALIAAHKAMDRSSGSATTQLERANSAVNKKSASPRGGQGVHFPSTFARGHQRSTLRSDTSHTSVKPRTAEKIDRNAYLHEALTTVSEASDFGENYGAQPSSYRRLKRAKSMLTPIRDRKHPQASTASDTPFSQAPTLRATTSTMSLRPSGFRLRLRRSLNLLRPLSRSTSAQDQDLRLITYQSESVALARQQFLSDQRSSQLNEKACAISPPKTRRHQKSLRKSLRSSFTQPDPVVDDGPTLGLSSVEGKKRSVSSSLRSKFFKTFGKRQATTVELPPQQMHASRAYFSKETTPSNSEAGFDSYHDSENGSVRRNSLYTPSAKYHGIYDDEHSPIQQLRASVSLESLHSASRSRVTSWTNSTMTGSAREASYEKNRLSVIKEDGGPHQPSSSAGRHIGGVSAFQQPMPSFANGSVDSQRVYSALMKRIDQEQVEIEHTKRALDKIHEAEETRSDEQQTSYPTVRLVKSSLTSSIHPHDNETTNPHESSYSLPANDTKSTQHQPYEHNTRPKRKVQVPINQSSFFPFSATVKHETASPFRVLLEKKKYQTKDSTIRADSVDSGDHTMYQSNGNFVGRGQLGHSSESIYSRNSDGNVNSQYRLPITSTDELSPPSSHEREDTGMATIIYSSYGHSDRKRSNSVRLPTAVSATTSEKGGWRGWAEHQMTALTRRGSKTSCHYREHAQINSDNPDDQIDFLRTGYDRNQHVSNDYTSKNGNSSFIDQKSRVDTDGDIEHVPLGIMSTNIRPIQNQDVDDIRPWQDQNLKSRHTVDLLQDNQQINGNERYKHGSSRKISPDNILNMLKVRKNRLTTVSQAGIGKENREDVIVATTPFSTPGRLQVQPRNGKEPKSLTQRVNAQHIKEGQEHESPSTESPSERFTSMLSARLSRPFDMDVPERNRPFDSMYLGKREAGFAEILRGDRLSVAPYKSHLKKWKSYGGLASEPFEEGNGFEKPHAEFEDTALPVLPVQEIGESRSTSFTGITSGSKRLVSNFLKSRKLSEDRKYDQLAAGGQGSRAFV